METTVTPERLMQMAWGFAPPLIIEAAVRGGVFDALANGPLSVRQVEAATAVSERGLRAVMDALVGLGLLAKDGADRDGADRYALTPESAAFLVTGAPECRGDFFRHISTQLIPGWQHLTDTMRSGTPPQAVNREDIGSPFFQEFVESLFDINRAAALALAQHLRIEDARTPMTVLDLAAGSGVWSIALAERSPLVRVTAVDWAGVLPATRRVTERCGVADRYRFVAGDLQSADFGTGHAIALLGHILHSEGPARSRALLRRTFDALAPGGTIAIAEFLVDADRTGPPLGLMFAVNMLLHTDEGGTFSFDEIAVWLREAGFSDIRALEAPAPSPLILANRPA